MKLRNKKTGEIVEWEHGLQYKLGKKYNSIKEFAEEWEDYKEPEDFYIVEQRGTVGSRFRTGDEYEKKFKQIGNYFETKEEAELAVRKLKAWKRLKDKGFRFEGIKQDYTRFFSQQKPIRIGRKYLQFNKAEDEEWLKENK